MDISQFNAVKLDKVLETENVARLLPEEQRNHLGSTAIELFERDLRSREAWQKRMNDAMKMAMQVVEVKNTPWANAANVKFPLITVAALQFSARAYPALLPDQRLVKVKIAGEASEDKIASAKRIEEHMSYQLLEEDEEWEEEFDRLLIVLPIMGCGFKKTFFDPGKGHNCSYHVLAKDFVVDYWTTKTETCRRKSHRYYKHDNEIYERLVEEYYLEESLGEAMIHYDPGTLEAEERTGESPDAAGSEDTPHELIEQHTWIDLDKDGYQEPYTMTVDRSSSKLLRLAKRFAESDVKRKDRDVKKKIAKIEGVEHFTKYELIPSPDRGFYGLGFGALMGPLNAAVDTSINQLLDSGTMQNRGGGFIARGLKMRGRQEFQVGEYKTVEARGDDIRKAVMPLPVNPPSQVLFMMLEKLIEYSERISSVSDIMAGQSPGQNQPATTTMAVLEQGMKVFSGIFKRLHRNMRDEFRKLYRMNAIYLHPNNRYYREGEVQKIFQADYSDSYSIRPGADPNMVSEVQEAMQAEALIQAAYSRPGYNIPEVERRWLKAIRVEDTEQVYPDPEGENAIQQQPSLDDKKLMLETKKAKAEITTKLAGLLVEAATGDAVILEKRANSIALLAKAESEEVGPQMEAYKLDLQALKDHRGDLLAMVDKLKEQAEMSEGGSDQGAVAGVEAPA